MLVDTAVDGSKIQTKSAPNGESDGQKTDDLPPVWTKAGGWDKDLLALASDYATKTVMRDKHEWICCDLEATMRARFPKTPKKDDKHWGDFAVEVLKRDPNTVAADIRAVAYCDKHEPAWRKRLDSDEFMPPPYLAARLASVKREVKRKELHALLFSNKFGTPAQFLEKIPKTGVGRRPDFKTGEKTDGNLATMTRAILWTHSKIKNVEQSFVIQESTKEAALDQFKEALKALDVDEKDKAVSFVVFTKKSAAEENNG